MMAEVSEQAIHYKRRLNDLAGKTGIMSLSELRQSILLDRVSALADEIMTQNDKESLGQLNLHLSSLKGESEYIPVQLATKMAYSKKLINCIRTETKLTIVIPMYNEVPRLLVRGEIGPQSHPNGENLIVEKSKQLEWVLGGNDNVSYDVILVDDQCPNKSGELAQQIISRNGIPQFETVLLQDLIIDSDSYGQFVRSSVNGLDTTKNSKKSGAAIAGLAYALEKRDSGIMILTDADLSTHLGQLGILIDPIVAGISGTSTGDRRGPTSVVERGRGRSYRRKLLMSLREAIFPDVFPLDTQCGFKAFSRPSLEKIVQDPFLARDFSFDLEVIARDYYLNQQTTLPVGIVWLDSPEESTMDGSVYLDMLATLLKLSNRFTSPEERSLRTSALSAISRIISMPEKWDGFLDFINSAGIYQGVAQNKDQLTSPDIINAIELLAINYYS